MRATHQKNVSRTSTVALVSVVAALGLVPVLASAHPDIKPQGGNVGYAIDQRGVVARSGYDLCWRTGFWTPEMAAPGCDGAAAAAAPAAPAAPAVAAQSCDFSVDLQMEETFDFDQATLKPAALARIDNDILARIAKCASVKSVTVVGHTDRMGTQNYNQRLSEKRANAVASYLTHKGVKGEKFETLGVGKTQPLPSVNCADTLARSALISCLAPNRRVTVEVKGSAK